MPVSAHSDARIQYALAGYYVEFHDSYLPTGVERAGTSQDGRAGNMKSGWKRGKKGRVLELIFMRHAAAGKVLCWLPNK